MVCSGGRDCRGLEERVIGDVLRSFVDFGSAKYIFSYGKAIQYMRNTRPNLRIKISFCRTHGVHLCAKIWSILIIRYDTIG